MIVVIKMQQNHSNHYIFCCKWSIVKVGMVLLGTGFNQNIDTWNQLTVVVPYNGAVDLE